MTDEKNSFLDQRCNACGRTAREHIWRCAGCGEPLAKDEYGYPVFVDEHGDFAELDCPPDQSKAN